MDLRQITSSSQQIQKKSVFDQIQHDFLIKILNIVGLEIIYLMKIKATYEGYITNIILYRKKYKKSFLLFLSAFSSCPSPFRFYIC